MNGDYLTLLFIAIMIVLFIQLIINYVSSKRQSLEVDIPRKIISRIRCVHGDYETEREFHEGDFVGKIEGACPKCGAELIIDTIYTKYLRQSTQSRR